MFVSRIFAVAIALGIPVTAAGQAPPAQPGPGGSPSQMVRAAGMPLQDGALPPGSLTVRVVQGAFTGDLSGIPVDLEVAGRSPLRAVTQTMGRAEFAHLPIGAQVSASATVNGSRLQSESFSMPADSGVRVLLIAGTETVSHGSGTLGSTSPIDRASVQTAGSPIADAAGGQARGVTIIQGTVAGLTVLTFAAMFLPRRRAGRRQTGAR
ncbi:MAG: hypothetical protein AB7N29_21150 [Vicinamibacterales bacterium]